MRFYNSRFEDVTDQELVVLAQSGDNPAFEELIERHKATCHRLAYPILRNKEDAEDEVQNAFWKAYEHIGQFQQDSKFSTWLSRIVVNQCLMRLRKDRRAKFVYMDEGVAGEEIPVLEFADDGPNPEEATSREQLQGVLRTEIARIPPLFRDALILRDVEELPMENVAERLGITVAAAKSRLLRARIELKNRLQKYTTKLGVAAQTA